MADSLSKKFSIRNSDLLRLLSFESPNSFDSPEVRQDVNFLRTIGDLIGGSLHVHWAPNLGSSHGEAEYAYALIDPSKRPSYVGLGDDVQLLSGPEGSERSQQLEPERSQFIKAAVVKGLRTEQRFSNIESDDDVLRAASDIVERALTVMIKAANFPSGADFWKTNGHMKFAELMRRNTVTSIRDVLDSLSHDSVRPKDLS